MLRDLDKVPETTLILRIPKQDVELGTLIVGR